jgi:hypothetical protein|tara:strand:+ start:1304 stop:1522 length:219 start_codon:yes stop_codon:yes gene_type:complete
MSKKKWDSFHQQRFMWMRSPQHALDVIADLIKYQASLKDQDAWLKACFALGYAETESSEGVYVTLMEEEKYE